MAESFVYGVVNATNSATPSVSVVGQGTANGDKGYLFVGFANSLGQTITDPAGWTVLDTLTDDSGNVAGKHYYRNFDGSETTIGVVFQVTGVNQLTKNTMHLWVGRGFTTAAPASAIVVESGSSATHTSPSVTTGSSGWRVTAQVEKSTTANTTWTQPSGDTKRGNAFNTGGGSATGFLSDTGASVSPSAGVISGGAATAAQVTNNAVMATVIMVPASTAVGVQAVVATADASAITPSVLGDRQFARPSTDVNVAGWTATPALSPMAQNTAETVPSDAEYIRSQDNPSAQVLELKFGSISNPNNPTGHVLRYRLKTEVANMSCTVQLVQGTTVIATFSPRVATVAGVTFADPIDQTSAASISNYADLRIRVTANG